MNQRKLQSVKSRTLRLARSNCANFTGQNGCHVTVGGRCALFYESESNGNVCPYFVRSVLPGEPKLEKEYRELFGIKDEKESIDDYCEECGRSIKRSSNRQKYCGSCSDEQARIKRNKRNREYRDRQRRDALGF
ncbi:hypothetical protein [Fictibacillus gelatini]|uniref:hypothetical protein n=1 Tax=Fictibacillus gelatini TaxID=225985 RepID=UPI00047CA6BF|nr:hypothetical protein [Fictibacillus gelatini]